MALEEQQQTLEEQQKLEEARQIAADISQDYPDWPNILPDCPCDEGEIKESEDFERSNMGIRTYHPGAENCYRSSEPLTYISPDNPEKIASPGQQCCYDESGKLITNGPGAGTPDLYSPSDWRNIGTHQEYDVQPYGGMSLEEYHKTWTPNNGNGCPENPVINPQTQLNNKLENIQNQSIWDDIRQDDELNNDMSDLVDNKGNIWDEIGQDDELKTEIYERESLTDISDIGDCGYGGDSGE